MQRSAPFRFVSKAAPTDSTGATVYTFRANDGEPDRYQDRVKVTGWKLDSFNANPVILFNHDEFSNLPIGKGRAYVQGDALMVDVTFDQADEFAKRVEAKVAGGYLNAVSVRYLMKSYAVNELGGFDSFEQDLLEISIVTIPGNQRAIRVKSFEPDELAEIVKALAPAVAALLRKEAPPPAEAPPAVEPAPEKKAGALVKCGSCEWKAETPACPECGGEVSAWQVDPKPAAEPAAEPEEKSLDLEALAREVARLTLSNLKEISP